MSSKILKSFRSLQSVSFVTAENTADDWSVTTSSLPKKISEMDAVLMQIGAGVGRNRSTRTEEEIQNIRGNLGDSGVFKLHRFTHDKA
jgi:hypothetical protein